MSSPANVIKLSFLLLKSNVRVFLNIKLFQIHGIKNIS